MSKIASQNENCTREMARLRRRLSGWIRTRGPEDMSDERWAESVVQELQDRGFVLIEKENRSEVLVCLRRRGAVQVGHAPTRALAVARTVRVFAEHEVGIAF